MKNKVERIMVSDYMKLSRDKLTGLAQLIENEYKPKTTTKLYDHVKECKHKEDIIAEIILYEAELLSRYNDERHEIENNFITIFNSIKHS